MKRNIWMAGGLLVVAGIALAADPGPADGPKGPRGRRDFKQELGLSDAQQKQLDGFRTEHRKWAIGHRAKVQVARIELNELFKASTIDEKAVGAKVKELSDLQAVGLKARVDQRLAMARILTPEQRQKIQDRPRFHRRDHRGPRRGFGGRGPRTGDAGPRDGSPGEVEL